MTALPPDPVLALAGVTKAYRRRRILEGVDLAVRPGDIVGLLGPNGSGKTTTMRIAAGYLWATAGDVYLNGDPLTPARRDLRRGIGYLPERVPLYDPFPVDDYLRFIAAARGLRGQARRTAIEAAIEDCGLGAVSRRTIGRLSRGYRQRVGIAQALIGNPRLLLLDEPTNGLDPLRTIETRTLIRAASRDRAIVISTHVLQEVAALCTRVVYLRRGRLVELEPATPLPPGQEGVEAVLGTSDAEAVEAAVLALDPGIAVLSREALPGARLRLTLSVPVGDDARARAAASLAAHAKLLEYGTLRSDFEARLVAAIGDDGERR